jgi:hypothetical protein
MTTRDKTREKLLNSMRKTKEVIGELPDAKQAHAETYAPPAAKPEKRAAPAQSEEVADPSPRPVLASDPYQSRGRVWPD